VLSIRTPDAARRLMCDDPVFFGSARPRFAAVVYAVRNLDRTRLCLHASNVPHRVEKTRIVVPSGAAFGVLTAFEAAA
jgi:hypothetical protein